MSYLYPILLVVIVVAADSGALVMAAGSGGGWRSGAAVAALPVAAVVVLTAGLVRWCLARVDRRGPRILITAGRITSGARWAILLNHAVAVLGFGWLAAIRGAVGDQILLDELVCLLPPILGWLAVWWLHYPIERRLREALLIRNLDAGQPIYEMPSRPGYVLFQARSGLLLLLVPILIIIALAESIDLIGPRTSAPPWLRDGSKLGSALLVFVLSPYLARAVLSVRPLVDGEIRDCLLDICRRHRVTVRQILVWHTGGSIINAAVMGLIGPLRYVLLTDALLESMTRPQVEAVMAHEVAHVRRHHMPWLVLTLMATISAAMVAVRVPLYAADAAGLLNAAAAPPVVLAGWLEIGLIAAPLVVALLAFGWVSRRFERQADTFAVQHLSGMGREGEAEGPGLVTVEAVLAMQSALARIAQLNTVDPRKHSWRHGSILWRQTYLASIISQPIGNLAIDRLVRWIKILAGVVLIASIGLEVSLSREREGRRTPVDPPTLTVQGTFAGGAHREARP